MFSAWCAWQRFQSPVRLPRCPKSTGCQTSGDKAASPRTPWGDPDLQGTWFVLADVPLERSAANAGKEFLTDEEVAAADEKKGLNPGRNARSADKAQDVSGAYNAVFNSVLKTGKRTSMIIDPPDGKIPPLVPGATGGQKLALVALGVGTARERTTTRRPSRNHPRCLGVPMPFLPLNTLFAQGTVMQVVQSPKSMAIYMEDDHAGGGNRVIFMDGRPHAPSKLKFYLGDSRGHWEGNTLVVETTNFSQGFRGSNIETYKMIERFTRVDANNLRREITFDDPKTWTKPWTVVIEMGRAPERPPHDLRFRVSRGELRHDGHPGGRPQGRAGREEVNPFGSAPLVLLLSFGSGVAALIYEVVWFQLLELVIGSTAVSLGMLLATFMGGMCLGSLHAAPSRLRPTPSLARVRADRARHRRSRNPGVAPDAVGGQRLHRLERIWHEWIPAARSRRGRLPSASDVADGRDAPCPGAPDRRQRTNGVSWLGFFYGANIAGAVLGCLLSGFYLLREYDVYAATYAAVAINLSMAVHRTRICRANSARGRSR